MRLACSDIPAISPTPWTGTHLARAQIGMGLRSGQVGRGIPEPEPSGATSPIFPDFAMGASSGSVRKGSVGRLDFFIESAVGTLSIGATDASRYDGRGFTFETPISRRFAWGADGDRAAQAKTHGQ